ncbi:MAG: acyl-CoA thioesterase [Candidatus Bruticola sp.]
MTMQEPTLKVFMGPDQQNIWGQISGGAILNQIDLAAGMEALHHAKGHKVVTVAIKEAVFAKPVAVGDVLSIYTQLERIGRTSLTIKVRVESERFKVSCGAIGEATVIYVAIDDSGRPVSLQE